MKWQLSQSRQPSAESISAAKVLKLDLGCGTNKRAEFLGIDRRWFAGVDGVADLTHKPWVFQQPELGDFKLQPRGVEASAGFVLPDDSVTEVHCSHFMETIRVRPPDEQAYAVQWYKEAAQDLFAHLTARK